VPHKTYSTHYIAHPEFKQAIGQFLNEESKHFDLYFEEKMNEIIYKKEWK